MMLLDFSQELEPLTGEQTYQVFTNTLHLCSGFAIIFLQCSPGETDRLIPRVRQELPGKNIEVLDLVEPISNLYRLVEGRADRASLNILFIRGLERSLESDIKPGYKGLGDYYNLNTVPPILSHLNQQRENFRDHFGNICFIFVLPRFAVRYFVRRAPDFYDWNSGVFEISESFREGTTVIPNYLSTTTEKSDAGNIVHNWESQHLLDPLVSPSEKIFKEANALCNLGRYKEAILSYDLALIIKIDDSASWYNRGMALYHLERYE
jgi:hypothetical protein